MESAIPRKLFQSGEIKSFTGIPRQTLHYYNKIGLLPEAERTASGRLLYDESVFPKIALIREYQRQQMTLDEIRQRLQSKVGERQYVSVLEESVLAAPLF